MRCAANIGFQSVGCGSGALVGTSLAACELLKRVQARGWVHERDVPIGERDDYSHLRGWNAGRRAAVYRKQVRKGGHYACGSGFSIAKPIAKSEPAEPGCLCQDVTGFSLHSISSPLMRLTHRFAPLAPERRPQDPELDGRGLRFETMDHGGEYPDAMPQAVRLTDAEGRSCIYVPIMQNGRVVDCQGRTVDPEDD